MMDAQKTKDLEVAGRFVLVTLASTCVLGFLARCFLPVDDGPGEPTSPASWAIGVSVWVLAIMIAWLDLRHRSRRKRLS